MRAAFLLSPFFKFALRDSGLSWYSRFIVTRTVKGDLRWQYDATLNLPDLKQI
jgi:hypothetical protein